jgi:hypothetical protein
MYRLSIVRVISSFGWFKVVFEQDNSEGQCTGVIESQKSNNDANYLAIAAKMFGFEEEALLTCLTKQNMYVGGNIIVKVQSYAQVRCQL